MKNRNRIDVSPCGRAFFFIPKKVQTPLPDDMEIFFIKQYFEIPAEICKEFVKAV